MALAIIILCFTSKERHLQFIFNIIVNKKMATNNLIPFYFVSDSSKVINLLFFSHVSSQISMNEWFLPYSFTKQKIYFSKNMMKSFPELNSVLGFFPNDIFLFSEFTRFPYFFLILPDFLQILIVFTTDLKAICHFFRVDAIGCFFLGFFPYLYFQRVYDDNQKHLIFFPEFIRFPDFLQILTVFIFLREFFLNLPFLL